MREIEFRAWLKKHLKLVNVKRIDFEAQEIVYDEIDFEYEDVIREKTALFKDISLLEYTGLKDKNGVKIFEGDIVRCDDEICTIVWDEQYLTYAVNFKEDGNTNLGDFDSKDLEVIGNIYENKELLG